MAHQGIDWATVDFTRSAEELAAELRVNAATVRRHRKKQGKPPPRLIDWGNVDLSLPTATLRKRYGATRAAISYQRRKRRTQVG